jgi:hypothetical protein
VVIGPFNAEATRTECWKGCFSPFLHSVVLPAKAIILMFNQCLYIISKEKN